MNRDPKHWLKRRFFYQNWFSSCLINFGRSYGYVIRDFHLRLQTMNHRGSAWTEIDRAAGSLIRKLFYDARNLWFSLVGDSEMVIEDL